MKQKQWKVFLTCRYCREHARLIKQLGVDSGLDDFEAYCHVKDRLKKDLGINVNENE